jgi:hypothetical protein
LKERPLPLLLRKSRRRLLAVQRRNRVQPRRDVAAAIDVPPRVAFKNFGNYILD